MNRPLRKPSYLIEDWPIYLSRHLEYEPSQRMLRELTEAKGRVYVEGVSPERALKSCIHRTDDLHWSGIGMWVVQFEEDDDLIHFLMKWT